LFFYASKQIKVQTNNNTLIEEVFEEIKIENKKSLADEEIIEIDTDVHFNRGNTGKV
jgi:hypothetical protein